MFITSLILIAVDHICKFIAYLYLQPINSIKLPILFNLTYVENRGAAFGVFQNQKLFFIFITIAAIAFIGYYYFKLGNDKRGIRLKFYLMLIFSGTIGNFIDRIFRGYVIDFIEFSFINFPVFNFADICLTIGSVLIICELMIEDKK